MVLMIATAALVFAVACSGFRIWAGPTPADRAVAADLLTFSVIGLVAVTGARLLSTGTLDLIIVATLVAFLAAVSLARALTRGAR
ncbi:MULTISPECIES: monovalent cation/H+ antiporter complex subunit F [unclassified Serinicoccus]|uniref:monovalent cation/H+ antiporter complex subunit F n=1 Tax=unclassified Serinicoccus TaxID=2643101 RepID=UPI0038528359